MKITIYELLGLVKDGKAPKKIIYDDRALIYDEGCEDYYLYYGKGLFEYKFENCKNFLNDEVEIIEEPKKIEKIEMCTGGIMGFDGVENITTELKNKINELIDEINKLKEK